MSRAAMAIAWVVSAVGNLCIAKVLGTDHFALTLLLIAGWTVMTTFIVAAVDESVRN